jgi:hypothetical protein
MPRAAVPVNTLSRAGIAVPTETTGDATNNHTIPNDGSVFLLVRNSNGASTTRTLTVRLSKTVDGQAVTSRTYPIAAGTSRYIGPFPPDVYGSSLLIDVDNAELKITAFHT